MVDVTAEAIPSPSERSSISARFKISSPFHSKHSSLAFLLDNGPRTCLNDQIRVSSR